MGTITYPEGYFRKSRDLHIGKDFNESDHPRDEAGRFTSGGAAPAATATPTTGAYGEQQFSPVGAKVDGRVVRDDIPNQSSIESSLDNYEIVPGVREVPFSAFTQMGQLRYYSSTEEARTKTLAAKIKASGEISPLIVVMDNKGPYILEGGHRFDALRELGAKSFPAMVVLDLDSLGPKKP